MKQFGFSHIAVICIFLNSCAYLPARYDNIQSARNGTPDHGTFSRQDYSRWENNQLSIEERGLNLQTKRMAVEKLNSNPPEIGRSADGTTQGYLGIVKNFSEYQTYNFIIGGKSESVAFLLGPGQQKEYYLLPDAYQCSVYYDNQQIGEPWTFQVTLQKHYFMDRWVHWYVLMRR
ncbi:hypothetical protein COT99_02525 [Candidatus Falkowbacteria bacterium CG10_big_fil_rev_8_21_14_0_10_43_10]|uniref:Uncharacterized protein n=1 Tax=Candidatus Falkowbacteria bacterium CG10_big_fil_rev_8_21_14_0_10_43_10 TaxID=1974567 RepID=A0A2H0V206_9BACT|nr:MAG: hypothetical protein COT99_02525 [Candidatus Falkowbacteria bacterium CG10_big_fil_rev_8_21_14_0_10_43_10]